MSILLLFCCLLLAVTTGEKDHDGQDHDEEGTPPGYCFSRPLDEPVAYLDADYIIAGLFNIGRLREGTEEINNVTYKYEYCSYSSIHVYSPQKALTLRREVLQARERFKLEHLIVKYFLASLAKLPIMVE